MVSEGGSGANHAFSLQVVTERFQNVVMDNNEVECASFLDAMEELSKVFGLLGKGFSFVEGDVVSKTKTLRDMHGEVDPRRFKVEAPAEKFSTFQHMVSLEVRHKITTSGKSNPNGSRTIMRLTWALEFICNFLRQLAAQDDASTSIGGIVSSAYKATLAHHHPWAVRQLVSVAVYALPSRRNFLESMHVSEADSHTSLATLTDVIAPILQNLTALFLQHGITYDLP